MAEKRQRRESVDELAHDYHAARPLVQRPRTTLRRSRLRHEDYTVAWICALYFEMASAITMLDEQHEELPTRDPNHYVLGRIGHHNVVIACLGAGRPGIPRATRVLTDLRATFRSVTRCLLVGVGGGFPKLPDQDIRLGDVVVGLQIKPYDVGRATAGGRFQRTGDNMRPSEGMSTALNSLQALHSLPVTATDIVNIVRTKFHGIPEYQHPETDDVLFLHTYDHVGPPRDCQNCVKEYVVTRPERLKQGPHIHYGAIASGSMVIKDGVVRETMYQELDVMCAETEAGGLEGIVPLVIRGISDYADSHKNDVFRKYASANAAAFAVEYLKCLKPIEPPGPPEAQSDTSRRHEEEAKEVEKRRKMRLSSIRFDHMSSRQFGITGRLMSTCQWMLEHESYLAWRDDAQIAEHLGFLWLKGKPGAGKSTLMRFAYEEHKKSEGRGRQRTSNTVMASFFFHARGEELQRSITGMYRSLVYQLFRGFPELGELLDDWELLPPDEKECPSLGQLRELFQRAISSLGNQQFVCYVDALDECDEKDVVYMARTFQDLAEEHNQRYPHFRVFFSSRHYPQVQSRIGLQLELDNQKGHTNDLQRYAESRLLYKDKGIKERLVGKARGVFMWIVLVVDILNKDSVGGMPISTASKTLEELPEDLSALFAEILKRHDSHVGEFIVAVVWILFATRPLTPEEFEHAIWSHSAVDGSADPPRSDLSTTEETDRLRQRVTRFTKGLAEVITNEDSSVVQFIHESVRDFLLRDQGLVQVWSDAGPHISSQGHEMLKICCENYINSAQIPQNFPRTQANRKELASLRKIYPLLEYSAQNILYHANNAEPVIPQTQFLLNLSIQSLNRCLSIFDKRGSEYYKPETDMLYLLADGGHARLINTWPHDLPMMCSSHGKYCSPLVVALAGKRTEAVSALLKLPAALCLKSHLLNGPGDRAQLRSGKGQSLLSWAAGGGHTELIRVLLDRGAGIDDLDPDGHTALARAVLRLSDLDHSTWSVRFLDHESNARSPAISMLLRNGAQWDMHTAIPTVGEPKRSASPWWSQEELNRHRFRWTLFEWGGREENFEDLLFMCRSGNCDKNTFLLHHAARRGRLEAVKLLTDNNTGITGMKFRLNFMGPWSYDTPFEEAIFGKHHTVAEFLLQKFIDACDEVDVQTFPFWSDTAYDQLGMLETLVEKASGVDWHLDFGTTPLARTSSRGSTKLAKWLIANGADVEGKHHRGRTPLLIASMEGEPAMVKVLLDHGANIESKDEEGRTPLLVASMRARWDTVQVLSEYGADHRACTQAGWSSLMFACQYFPHRSEDTLDRAIRQLLQEGADVNHRGKLGETPLRLAVERGNVPLVKFLLLKGADIAARDDKDRTVLEYLSQSSGQQIRDHADIVQALQEHHKSLFQTGR